MRTGKMWIKWWVGIDAIKFALYPPGTMKWHIRIFLERILWKLVHRLFWHWVNHKELIPILIKFGIAESRIRIVETPWERVIYPKKLHTDINVIVYLRSMKKKAEKYKNWIYGKNLIGIAIRIIKNVNWIILDGSKDMSKIYPITDYYLKVNSSIGSGINRIAKECEINSIPVFFTDYLKSDLENARNFAKVINEYIRKNKSNI